MRNLVRAGVPENVAMAISGHKTRSVFCRYDIVDEDDVKQAGRAVANYLRESTEAMRNRVLEFDSDRSSQPDLTCRTRRLAR